MYIKSILIISILFLFLKPNILIETINQPLICGNLRNSDINYSDPNPPFKIKRCLRGSWDNPGTLKTHPKCCEGTHECKPTKYGGYCQSNIDSDEKFIYEDIIEDGDIVGRKIKPYGERTRLSESAERRFDVEDREQILREVLGDMVDSPSKKEKKDFDKMVIKILNYVIIAMFIFFIGLLIYLLIKPDNIEPSKYMKPEIDVKPSKYMKPEIDVKPSKYMKPEIDVKPGNYTKQPVSRLNKNNHSWYNPENY
jgi:hypothetical protein